MPSDQSRSINPLRLAKARERIEGCLQLDSLVRLKDILLENSGELKYSLSFDFDETGVCIVETGIESQLVLECQRCLDPVVIEIHQSSLLGIVKNKDELGVLAKDYEPLQLDEEIISVEELVEDELLLSLPQSPTHTEHECAGKEDLDRINAEAKQHPFAVLTTLKEDRE
ncbi:MAG: YceD family protein [Proteobacteria bacterium]|nr:YceD family protein [Pseudomonadota bacterium]